MLYVAYNIYIISSIYRTLSYDVFISKRSSFSIPFFKASIKPDLCQPCFVFL